MNDWLDRVTPPRGPLDQVEDRELVRRAQEGDERSFEELLRRYRPVARRRARAYFLDGHDRDDLSQEALLGLWKAIRGFDLSMDTPFVAFAELCIERQLYTIIKMGNRNKHLPMKSYEPLDAAVMHDGSLRMHRTLASMADEPAMRVISGDEIAAIRGSFLDRLSELERRVVMLVVEGNSYEEMAAEVGATVKSIDNALQRIRKKLRNHVQIRDADRGTSRKAHPTACSRGPVPLYSEPLVQRTASA